MQHKREQNIKFALLLNISFTVIEIVGGILTNSLAILSDALHDFGDSIALGVSLFAERKAQHSSDDKRTFGYQRLSLFSAIFSALILVSGSLFILSEAIPRLLKPEHVNAAGMIGLAILGITVNSVGVFRLKMGASMSEKVLSWHLLEDVLGWVVILVGGIIMYFWDSHIIDPIMTVGFTIFIFWGVGKNLKEIFNIFLQGVPEHIDMEKIKKVLMGMDGVCDVHDIHIWSLEGETDIFTSHIVVEDGCLGGTDKIRKNIKEILYQHHIEHSTLEIESKRFCSGIECKN